MVLLVTAVLLALRLAAELSLNALNRREVRRHAGAPPSAVAAIVDEATYARAVAYTLEKNSFGRIEMAFDAGVLALAVFSGVLPWLFTRVDAWAPGAAWSGAAFILLVGGL